MRVIKPNRGWNLPIAKDCKAGDIVLYGIESLLTSTQYIEVLVLYRDESTACVKPVDNPLLANRITVRIEELKRKPNDLPRSDQAGAGQLLPSDEGGEVRDENARP